MNSLSPLEQLLEIAVNRRSISIGIPTPSGDYERRSLLTPEAAGMLVDRGIRVLMQAGAGSFIHYTDTQYSNRGVSIVPRPEAMRADIVLHPAPLAPVDARLMRRASMLLTFFHPSHMHVDALRLLLEKHIVTIALDLIKDSNGNRPFADILDEIDGRAAMAIASSLLADAVHGKGILLGGVSGVVPCEVTIIGSNIAAQEAARAAMGLGAIVRMFDNDVYRLRTATHRLGPGVIGSALHPKVLISALRSADVVVATPVNPPHVISASVVESLKRGVITFDIASPEAPATFPTLPRIDLADASARDNSMDGSRACYINPGNAVPRTSAMAMSNTFITMLNELLASDGVTNALKLNAGIRCATLTFLGKPVNETIARKLGMRPVDINLILQFS